MWKFDTSRIPEMIGIAIFFIVVMIIVDIWLARKGRTEEEAELLALRFNHWGTMIGLLSVGSASGISFGNSAPLVVTFVLGSPISLNLLIIGYYIQSNLIKKRLH